MAFENTEALMGIIKSQLLDYAKEEGIELSIEELRNAIAGIEYCISEYMTELLEVSLSHVTYERERLLK